MPNLAPPQMAGMWRRSASKVPSLLQFSSFHSSSIASVRVIPAELAQLVSLQTPGMIELPTGVQQAIDQAAAGKPVIIGI